MGQEATAHLLDSLPEQDAGMVSAVLSPVQMAAVLERASIGEDEIRMNRIWGAVGLLGGALELLGSAALLMDPDPTASKIFGAIGIVHGNDVIMTSWAEVLTGRPRATATADAIAALAQSIGVPAREAATVGAIVDIAVPVGVMSAVARSASLARLTRVRRIRRGFVSLEEEEKVFNFTAKPSASAHTIAEHVGMSLKEMENAFVQKSSREAMGSFSTLKVAEDCVSEVLKSRRELIRAWAQAPGVKKPLALAMRFSEDVGTGILNEAKRPNLPRAVYAGVRVRTVTVILNKTSVGGRTWYVLTSYPDVLRDLGLIPM